MEVLKIVINSLEDSKNGIPAIKGVTPENVKQTKDITVVILEGGTVSGATSLMFALKHPDGQICVAEITGNHLEGLYQAYKGAKERFGK